MRVYDGRDATGGTWSEGRVRVAERLVGGATKVFTLPFNGLSTYGPHGPADIRYIGAIKFQIADGYWARDLILGPLQTDGRCTTVPVNGVVIDACGVCGGDGSSCRGCDGVPNSAKVIDRCGVCGGDGMSCAEKGCDGVPGSGKRFDVCGVCGGDGSSCKGCDGVPNSGKKTDICGVCGGNGASCLDCKGVPHGSAQVDTCGVCGGDGSSCNCSVELAVRGAEPKIKAITTAERHFMQLIAQYAQIAQKCSGNDYSVFVAKAKAIAAEIALLLQGLERMETICPDSLCTTETTATIKGALKRLARQLDRLLSAARTQAVTDCHVKIVNCYARTADPCNCPAVDYLLPLLKAIKGLPHELLQCRRG